MATLQDLEIMDDFHLLKRGNMEGFHGTAKEMDIIHKNRNENYEWVNKGVITEFDKYTIQLTLEQPNFKYLPMAAMQSPSGVAFRINPITGQKEMFVRGTMNPRTWTGKFEWFQNAVDTGAAVVDDLMTANYEYERGEFLKWAKSDESGLDLSDTEYKNLEETVRPYEFSFFRNYANPWTQDQAYQLDSIARREKPDIIYGHSKAATVIARMEYQPAVYIALDGNMYSITNPKILNVHDDSIVDRLMNRTSMNPLKWNSGFYKKHIELPQKNTFHRVWWTD